MKTPNYVFDDELYHHGVEGQKHGVRRWQNEDGSLTPEGYIHYGYGKKDAREKHNLQMYKANLKSDRQQYKDTLSAREERNRIKEIAKNNRLIRKEERKQIKEQARNERLQNKEKSKTNQVQRTGLLKNSRKMSNEQLEEAVERLRLEAEYNKNLLTVNDSKSALARADRFIQSETGKAIKEIAIAVLPNVTKELVTQVTPRVLNYPTKLDREAKENENRLNEEKARTEIEKQRYEQERQRLLLKQLRKNKTP